MNLAPIVTLALLIAVAVDQWILNRLVGSFSAPFFRHDLLSQGVMAVLQSFGRRTLEWPVLARATMLGLI